VTIPTCLTETAIVPRSKPLIATATAAGLVGLGAAALLAPGPSPTASSTAPPAPEVRTQVVTQVIHRVRVTEHGRQRAPAIAAAVPIAAPAPIATPPAVPVRTRASGADEKHEDEHAEREHEALEEYEEADD
jgi:hypothetical protein